MTYLLFGFGVSWGPSRAVWGVLGPRWGHLGRLGILWRSCAVLEICLGPSWTCFGTSSARFGASCVFGKSRERPCDRAM